MIQANPFTAVVARGARVLVISPDMLPLGGRPASGAGLRAWALGQGLRAAGHDVLWALPRETAAAAEFAPQASDEAPVAVFEPTRLDDFLAAQGAEAAVFQHWPAVNLLRRSGLPVAIDFHGPLLLETLYHSGGKVTGLYRQKLRALARADFFTCAGERQRNYFYAWLQMAGFDLRELPIEVVPFAWSPQLPEHRYPDEPRFVFGGMFLPWQNPALGLRVLVEELERAGRGQLDFFGGKHPRMQFDAPDFDTVLARLADSPRATVHPLVPRAQLLDRYARSSVAWDVMPHNCERGMAITSRTVEYLWAGLPVVYQRYAELADDIAEFEAGWLVDPCDEEQLRQVVAQILASPAEVVRRGENAQRLIRERRTWTAATRPLARWVAEPRPAARLASQPFLAEPGWARPAEQLREGLKRLVSLHPWTESLARRTWRAGRQALGHRRATELDAPAPAAGWPTLGSAQGTRA